MGRRLRRKQEKALLRGMAHGWCGRNAIHVGSERTEERLFLEKMNRNGPRSRKEGNRPSENSVPLPYGHSDCGSVHGTGVLMAGNSLRENGTGSAVRWKIFNRRVQEKHRNFWTLTQDKGSLF